MLTTSAPEYLVKAPSERRYYTMDFSNLMDTGETITRIDSITSEKRGGATSDLLIADSGIVDQTVGMWIQNGTNFQTYRVEVQISTSAGQVLQGDGLLKVSDK
jgi:hypothetical protein